MENNGKWFAHAGLPVDEISKREACTSTGSMLAMREAVPLGSDTERYPKTFLPAGQKTSGRVYPCSARDNRYALQNTISAFDDGLGRKKCLDERRQHNSHFGLWHPDGVRGEPTLDFSAYQMDYQDSPAREGATCRRFPKNHMNRSAAAAAAVPAGQPFLWFGRHDSEHTVPLRVLAATNHSSSSTSPR